MTLDCALFSLFKLYLFDSFVKLLSFFVGWLIEVAYDVIFYVLSHSSFSNYVLELGCAHNFRLSALQIICRLASLNLFYLLA